MVVLGILLLAVAAVTAGTALVAGDDATTLNLIGAELDTTVRWVFVAGAVSLLLLVIGLALLAAGLRRARARRKEMKQLKSAAGSSAPQPPASSPDQRVTRTSASTARAPETGASRAPVSPEDPDEQTR